MSQPEPRKPPQRASTSRSSATLTSLNEVELEAQPCSPTSPTPSGRSTFRRRETEESLIHGYPRLAHYVGSERGFAIFRRFASLNAKSLLYFQAEILQLEQELNEIEEQNSTDDEGQTLQTQISRLMHASRGSAGHRQWQKILEIRGKLREYNQHLLEHEKLYQLSEPNPSDFEDLRIYLYEQNGKWLDPLEDIWAVDETDNKKSLHHDLVALSSRNVSNDKFTRWVIGRAVPFYDSVKDWLKGTAGQGGNDDYSDEHISHVIGSFTTVFASLLPSASIFALYYIHSTVKRLIFIMVFSLLFTMCLAIFTDAKRIEIFAAAVALASVQVVFIGTNGVSTG